VFHNGWRFFVYCTVVLLSWGVHIIFTGGTMNTGVNYILEVHQYSVLGVLRTPLVFTSKDLSFDTTTSLVRMAVQYSVLDCGVLSTDVLRASLQAVYNHNKVGGGMTQSTTPSKDSWLACLYSNQSSSSLPDLVGT
jgi:hypothetical protein